MGEESVIQAYIIGNMQHDEYDAREMNPKAE